MFGKFKNPMYQLLEENRQWEEFNKPAVPGFLVVMATIDDSSTFYYDYYDYGKIKTATNIILESSGWKNNTRNSFLYNKVGSRTSDLREVWADSAWQNTQRFTYTYDEFDREICELNQYWLNDNWENSNQRKIVYGNQENHYSYLSQNWVENEWQNVDKYNYEAENNSEIITHERWQNNTWVKDFKSYYFWTDYSDSSVLIQIYSTWKDNQWIVEGRNTWCRYFAEHKMVTICELLTDTGWINTQRQTIVSGTSNNYNLVEVWIDNSWVNSTRRTDSSWYNTSVSLYERWENHSWVNVSRYTNYTNTQRNTISQLNEGWLNNRWENLSRQTYRYDMYGNCIYADYFEWYGNNWTAAKGQLSFPTTNGDYWFDYYANTAKVVYSPVTDAKNSKVALTQFELSQNYPNPFNPSTTIKYSIPHECKVLLTVYNLLGQKVTELINETKLAGTYEVQFNAGTLSSGLYFYRLQAGGYDKTKKFILVK